MIDPKIEYSRRSTRNFAKFVLLICMLPMLFCIGSRMLPVGPSTVSADRDVMASTCREDLDGMNALLDPVTFPDHFRGEDTIPHPGDFDPNQFFTVFKHLRLEEGYRLDYVFHYGGFIGLPVVYARKTTDPAYTSLQDYLVAKTGSDSTMSLYASTGLHEEYLSHVILDGTPESYLEYTLLYDYGIRFYGVGYSNFRTSLLMCDKSDIPDVEKRVNEGVGHDDFPKSIGWLKGVIDFTPTVRMDEDHIKVRYLNFSYWGGLQEVIYTYDRNDKVLIPEETHNIIIYYDCGIVY